MDAVSALSASRPTQGRAAAREAKERHLMLTSRRATLALLLALPIVLGPDGRTANITALLPHAPEWKAAIKELVEALTTTAVS